MVRRKKDACAQMLKALGNDDRLSVVRMLMEGAKTVEELNQQLRLDSSLLSYHLGVLRRSGLVTAAREGQTVRYELAPVAGRLGRSVLNLGCCCLDFGSASSYRSPTTRQVARQRRHTS